MQRWLKNHAENLKGLILQLQTTMQVLWHLQEEIWVLIMVQVQQVTYKLKIFNKILIWTEQIKSFESF